jgi:hypothetical protein
MLYQEKYGNPDMRVCERFDTTYLLTFATMRMNVFFQIFISSNVIAYFTGISETVPRIFSYRIV